jgi:DNA-binding transcriptional ArsR family regulator
MGLLRLSPLALSRSRFALSPLAETYGAMRALVNPSMDPWIDAWHAQHAPKFRSWVAQDPFTAGMVNLLTTTSWLPAMITTPPSGGMRTTIGGELDAIRRHGDAQVQVELEQSVRHMERPRSLAWLRGGRDWAARTADIVERAWREHIEPDWPRRRTLLERDVAHRAGQVAVSGWFDVINGMTRKSGWVGTDAIRFNHSPMPDRVVADEGMLFVPYSQSRGFWLAESPPDSYAIVYPARGSAESAHPAESSAGDRALDRLIGPVRARILRELARPATTSDLATLFGLSLGTVGGHLSVLRTAGLVEGDRTGRRVIYRRTEAGDQLAAASR